ncbi:hypothetical protein ACFY0F_06095 [Streptomyces sp. NPDC001544]
MTFSVAYRVVMRAGDGRATGDLLDACPAEPRYGEDAPLDKRTTLP